MREMSNLDKALETLKETKKGTQWGDQKHKEAIGYLESLKPTIPIFVARWFEDSIKNQMSIYTIVDYYASSDSRIPIEISSWMETLDKGSRIEIMLANMFQFGYNIQYDTKYIIKAPTYWKDCSGGDQYISKSEKYRYELVNISKADKFTKPEAEELMDTLHVNWEIVEVEK